ncbi:formylglycine-generating enzyme family protein [Candidatus Poribacteria bacterium]|nr:formylglycine-generating enzyme family protein [Candidatus Poribacteria bacterium]
MRPNPQPLPYKGRGVFSPLLVGEGLGRGFVYPLSEKVVSVIRWLLFGVAIVLVIPMAFAADDENMIRIPAGWFTMGSENRGADEKPVHRVYLDGYDIGQYEVTNEEYYKFWKATGEHKPENFSDEHGIGMWPDRALKFPRHPVVGVAWTDAVAYAKWVGMRLPTEAEWEKAARGLTDRLWPWGGALKPYANTWNGKDGYDNTIARAGSFPDGKSYYGAMDMAGNVWEWTADRYNDVYYTYSPKRNPKGPDTGSWRVIRGGAWTDNINRCTTTFRLQFYPGLKTSFIGFRLARTVESSSKKPSSNPAPQK